MTFFWIFWPSLSALMRHCSGQRATRKPVAEWTAPVIEFEPVELVTSLRATPPGVRLLAPTGQIGYVPEEQLAAALEAGAVIVTPQKMREIRQAIFMEHAIFDERHNRQPAPRHRRKSLWQSGKR